MIAQQVITQDMTIGQIMEKYPFAAEIMLSYGLHCVGCHVNPFDTIENGARVHGMTDEQMNDMLQELNEFAVKKAQDADQHVDSLTITDFAASKMKEIIKSQGKEGYGIRISVSKGGCSGNVYGVDFENEESHGDTVIEKNDLKIYVDPESTKMLSGVEIDYIESLVPGQAGFKFNNPNAKSTCGCGQSFH